MRQKFILQASLMLAVLLVSIIPAQRPVIFGAAGFTSPHDSGYEGYGLYPFTQLSGEIGEVSSAVFLPLVMNTTPDKPNIPALASIYNLDWNGNYLVEWTESPARISQNYQVQEAADASFTANVTEACVTVDLNCQINGKMAGTYYYRVRGINQGVLGEWSNVQSAPVWAPQTPYIERITNLYKGTYNVNWYGALGVTSYLLQEDSDASFSSPRVAYSGTESTLRIIDQPDGTYYYRAKSFGPTGESIWSDVKSVQVITRPNWEAVVSQDFEGVFPGAWQIASYWQDEGVWYDVTEQLSWGKRQCFEPDYNGFAIGGGTLGSTLECNNYYPDNYETWMVYGPFDLGQVLDGRFTMKGDVHTPYGSLDRLGLGVSLDGNMFYGQSFSGWRGIDEKIDLKNVNTLGNVLGKQVWIGIWFVSDESINTGWGAYVDDIMVATCNFSVGCEEPALIPPLDSSIGDSQSIPTSRELHREGLVPLSSNPDGRFRLINPRIELK
jgi:hypothetical protein